MTQASTCDGQLSPVCPWCGQAGCQVWCKEVAFGQSADSSTTLHSRFPGLHIVCMKQASTFDVQLSPGCPWCGQVGNQAWCNEVAMDKSRVTRSCRSRSTQQKHHCRCVLKGSWVFGSFFGYGCPYSCFWLCYSILGLYETVSVFDSCTLYLGHHPLNPSTLVNA